MSAPLLVTGGTGYLGRELLRQAAGRPLVATYLTHPPAGPDGVADATPARPGERHPPTGTTWLRLDVRDKRSVGQAIERLRPATVIHTAYRQDDRATTFEGAVAVARAAAAAGARLVHLSTDVLFDGTKPGPYVEDDPPGPLTDYGRAKADAEQAVLSEHPAAMAIRTSLLYGGPEPSRHELAALDAAAGRADISFFDDELRSPIVVGDLAAALLELAERDERGVLHVAGADSISRYEFACLIAASRGLRTDRIRRGSLASSGLRRPANCALDSSRAGSLLRTRLHGARERLAAEPVAADRAQP
jgi:dTDP-4-dehydrorhamnose reductase